MKNFYIGFIWLWVWLHSDVYRRFREVEYDTSFNGNRTDDNDGVDVKLHLMREAIAEYERRLGFEVKEPIMTDTKWNLWGGVYYSASLYTTIG